MRLEPICICAEGWTGDRCMHKETDGSYNVKVNYTQESTTSESLTSTEAVTEPTERPKFHPDLIDFPTTECPSPWKEDFCLNGGICRSLSHGFHFLCHCVYPYTGERCSHKALDGIYLGLDRHKRDLLAGNILKFLVLEFFLKNIFL
jgi:hypothetical protein